jgi:hypothetical protein
MLYDDVQERLRARWGAPPTGPFWDEIAEAVRFGWDEAHRPDLRGRTWESVERFLRAEWRHPDQFAPDAEVPWDEARDAVRLAWEYANSVEAP